MDFKGGVLVSVLAVPVERFHVRVCADHSVPLHTWPELELAENRLVSLEVG